MLSLKVGREVNTSVTRTITKMIKQGGLNTSQFNQILKDFEIKLQKRDIRIFFRHLNKSDACGVDYAKFYHVLKFKPSVKKIVTIRNLILSQLGPEKVEIILNREPDPSTKVYFFLKQMEPTGLFFFKSKKGLSYPKNFSISRGTYIKLHSLRSVNYEVF